MNNLEIRQANAKKRLEISERTYKNGKWTDVDLLEYMLYGIEPGSLYWRLGMRQVLKRAIKLVKEKE